MALAAPEFLSSDSRPRSMSKLAESPAGPAPRFSGRIMTPTKPMSADLTDSGATSGVRRSSGSRGPGAGAGKKKEAFVDPNVSMALAAALKAELALAEFDAPPEILQEMMAAMPPPPLGTGTGSAGARSGGIMTPQSLYRHQHQHPSPSAHHPNNNLLHLPPHTHHHQQQQLVGASNNQQQPGVHPPYLPPQPQQVLTVQDIRARAEMVAEFEVEHNWLLKEEAETKFKKFDQTKRKLAIYLPDDDPLEGISNRLEEVQSMVKPKVDFSHFIDDLAEEQRDSILRIANKANSDVIRERRHNWKSADFIRNTFRMIYIMVCNCHPGRRYFNPEDPEAGPAVMRRQRKIYGHGKAPIKSSLSDEMQLSLTTHPDYRTNYDLRRVLWVLRATKAFKHLFPTEMEKEVAKVVGYERYDDNRHIGYQGRSPQRFYYVLSGRIQMLKEYRLTTGCVNKSMGFMNKGMTSDPEELEQGWFREYHLVTKGPVEVLILHKDDFIRLQHTVQGPPVDFLWSIDLFKEFPCDHFFHNPDAIEFKYYGQNRIVERDIFRTPWLHVVKSGIVKVVRVQYVFDVRNERRFTGQSTEELGCGRSFSHAQAMLGLLAKQRKMKTMASELSLPELFDRRSQASIEDGRRGKRRKSRFLHQLQNQKSHSSTGDIPSITVEETDGRDEGHQQSVKQKSDVILPPIHKSNHEPTYSNSRSESRRSSYNNNNNTNDHDHGQASSSARESRGTQSNHEDNPDGDPGSSAQELRVDDGPTSAGSRRTGSANLQRTPEAPAIVPHGTFLTREKTEADTHPHNIPPGVEFGKKAKKESLVRKAYLQLDLLKPGDVFGLDDIAQKFRYHKNEVDEPGIYPKDLGLENLDPPPVPIHEGPAISLVSDGAEVIKISKRFFLQHAQNNTMLRVETMQRSYLSTDEAKSILYDKETWAQYKHVLMQRLIDGLPR